MAPKRKQRIALLHYSCPPIIGGVEFILEAHAHLLARFDHPVELIVGEGEALAPDIALKLIPEIASHGGPIRRTIEALHRGTVPKSFTPAVRDVEKKLAAALKGIDVCIMHNVMTMHFNLVLTAALANLARRMKRTRFIAWTHDSTFGDPAYKAYQREDYPWSLLSEAVPGCEYCVISQQRQKEIKRLFNVPASSLPVIPDGIDVRALLGLTERVTALFHEERLHRKDIVALTPTRIVRRKNLEAGLQIVAALKKLGKTVRWMITGAPDHHNDDAMSYFRELTRLRRKLKVENEVIFLCERFRERVTNQDMRGLYGVSNVLLFPSEREGFGIPVLEAGLTGLLVIISDIPSLRELGGRETVYIYPDERPETIACRIIRAYNGSPRLTFKRKIISQYSWDALFVDKILPAIERPRSIWRERGPRKRRKK